MTHQLMVISTVSIKIISTTYVHLIYSRSHLVFEFWFQIRTDWENTKIDVMYRAIKCKFSSYPHLTNMLLSTVGSVLVEASPHDLFWGGGREGEGLNYLGRLLMQLRAEILGTVLASTEVGEAD